MAKNSFNKMPQCDDDLLDALTEAYRMARRGKTKTEDEQKFEAFWMENLIQLRDDIINRTYKPGRSKAFITHEPVDREIFAAQFRDRIVHHFIYAVVAPWWDKRFIWTSSSCREGKGTDHAVKCLQKAMRQVSQNGKCETVVMKRDLSGYFMSLSRKELYKEAMRGLNKQFPDHGWLFKVCEFLWHEIIFDDPTLGVRMAGSPKDWVCLPLNKSLFHQMPGIGIVIGNLTSQLLSNIFLNDFDWFMKKKKGFKYYGRYVDDFYVVVRKEDAPRARKILEEDATEFLAAKGVKMHPAKIYEQDVRKGCPFLGKVVHLNGILPGKRYKKNARAAMRKYVEGRGSMETMISYLGMAKHMKANKFWKKTFDELGGEYRF